MNRSTGVVADDGQAVPVRLKAEQDRGLQTVRILIFVDQNMIKALCNIVGDGPIGHDLRPIKQQVVVIEHVLLLLGLHIGSEQLPQVRLPLRTPREKVAEHLVKRRFGIDGA
jgi:hypothetical protein